MMDTKSLMQWGLVVVGSVMGLAVVMLGVEAVVHDGEVANTIVQQLIGVLVWGMPVIGGVLGLHQLSSAYVAVKQATAQQQTAQTQAVVAAASVPTAAPVMPPPAGL